MAPADSEISSRHPESLLRIPLAAQLLRAPGVPVVVRGIDSRWAYSKIVGGRVDGFNPFAEAIFVGAHSHLACWLPNAEGSARDFNRDDGLISELLFAIHDYLHIWCYRWTAELWPELGFGTAPITRSNFEDMVFCHLLSEAVATAGLDYWYLACVRLNDVVPIGTRKEGLTVSYSRSHEDEYRRFHPALEVQAPKFLETLTRFYCDGIFPGFSADDMDLSPMLRGWLVHELSYGAMQRRYCRQWFAYLSSGAVKLSDKDSARPVRGSVARQRRLTAQIADLLWSKVKHDDPSESGFRFDPTAAWKPPNGLAREYQFVNLARNGLPERETVPMLSSTSFRYLVRQFVAGFDQSAFPEDAVPLFRMMYDQRDFEVGRCLLDRYPRLDASGEEPASMFFFN